MHQRINHLAMNCGAVGHIYNKAIIKYITLLPPACVQKASKVKLGPLPEHNDHSDAKILLPRQIT